MGFKSDCKREARSEDIGGRGENNGIISFQKSSSKFLMDNETVQTHKELPIEYSTGFYIPSPGT